MCIATPYSMQGQMLGTNVARRGEARASNAALEAREQQQYGRVLSPSEREQAIYDWKTQTGPAAKRETFVEREVREQGGLLTEEQRAAGMRPAQAQMGARPTSAPAKRVAANPNRGVAVSGGNLAIGTVGAADPNKKKLIGT